MSILISHRDTSSCNVPRVHVHNVEQLQSVTHSHV